MLQRLWDWSDVCALGLPCQKGQARKLIKNVGIDIGSTTVKMVVWKATESFTEFTSVICHRCVRRP